jgi:ankyrin repeat protein
MKWPLCFHVLAVLICTGTSLLAQTSPPLSTVPDAPTTIPLDAAEEHLIENPPPKYPPLAKVANVRGDVHLTLEVDSNGAVVRVIPLSGHPLLIQAAADAARQYRYRPFELNGAPANVLVDAVVSFLPNVPPHVPFPEVKNQDAVLIEYNDYRLDLRVHGDGVVEYDGTAYVAVKGKHQLRISSEEVSALVDALRQADFFSLGDEYPFATDSYTNTTSAQIGATRKVITDYGVEISSPLKGVKDAILKYSHSNQWVTGNAQTIPALIEETPNPSTLREVLSNLLPNAASYGDTGLVLDILSHQIDLERRGPYDATALMLASERGLPDVVTALLKAGANPRATDNYGRSALLFAAGSGNAEVVHLLLEAGLNGNDKDKYGDTALMAAAASGNPESVRLLLTKGAKVNTRNKRRQTALLSAAKEDSGFYIGEAGRSAAEIPDESIHRDVVVKLLLDAGARIEAQAWDGETALFSLDDDVIQELLRHHINLEIRDKNGDTALTETVAASVAELLIKAGANVNARGYGGKTALIQAAENNFVDKLEVLLNAPDIRIDLRDAKGETALMRAQIKHLNDCVRLLLAKGATE